MPNGKTPRRRSAAPPPETPAPPRLVIGEDRVLERIIRSIQLLTTCYPRAASVAVQAIVNEGRAFARQPEGDRLMRNLSEAEWVERGRILWEACGLDALLSDGAEPNGTGPFLPSTWIRLLVSNLTGANLESTLSGLMFDGSAAQK